MSTHSPEDAGSDVKSGGENGTDSKINRARRPKACKQCHALKVRCIPVDETDPNSSCVRCVNANKECEIDSVEPKKRRKKNPARSEKETMADLKAQVSALQSEISILRQRPASETSAGTPGGTHTGHSPFTATPDSSSPPFMTKSDLEKELGFLGGNDLSLKDVSDEIKMFSDLRDNTLRNSAPVDAVSLGLLDLDSARSRLDDYRSVLYSLHSYVRIPQHTTVEELMRTQPYLFNAVMAITSVVRKDDANFSQCLALEKHAISAVTTEILVNGTKTVELAKCLILLSIWYNIPEFFKARRYHILNQMAVTLLYDLGIVSRQSFTYSGETKTIRKAGSSFEQIEYRVLILTLYCTTVGFCLILRRAIYVKWTTYVEECCALLEKNSDQCYKNVALFSRLTRELEKVHHIVHSPECFVTNPKISTYTMTELNTRLSVAGNSLSKDNHILLAYYYSIEAYLFQPSSEDLQVRTGGLNCTEGLTTRTLTTISQCTSSCLKAMDEFNQLTEEQIAGLPLFHFTRIIYTAGILMRLRYFILSLPSNIEKDLVPRYAIVSVSNLHQRMNSISAAYPTNFLMKKMKLVLRLFVQTYVTQVNELLARNDDGSVSTLSPSSSKADQTSMNKLAFSLMAASGNQIGHNTKPGLHLDLLSYAATEHRKTSGLRSQDKKKGKQPKNTHSRLPQVLASANENNVPFPSLQKQNFNGAEVSADANAPQIQGQYANVGVFPPPPEIRPQAADGVFEGPVPGAIGDFRDQNKDIYEFDDEFWSNLLTADADKYLFTQDVPNAAGNVLYNIFN